MPAQSSGPWDAWFHCVVTTYGAWLPGDPRGFRTRQHREHVQGDYKNRPAQDYRERLRVSESQMKRPPVVLSALARQVVCAQAVRRLQELGCDVRAVAVAPQHLHVLLRVQSPHMAMRGLSAGNRLSDGRDPLQRHVMGMMKKHVSHTLREQGMGVPGGVWGRRGKSVPIKDARHFENTCRYILRHHEEGAVVWDAKGDNSASQ